jgi:hypothetical protein
MASGSGEATRFVAQTPAAGAAEARDRRATMRQQKVSAQTGERHV